MPKIIKTRGICLSSQPIRETSKLVTFYAENFGKITLTAKGGRNPKSKFGAALEVFTLSEIIFYKSESKPIYLLSDATVIDAFTDLKSSEKYLSASQITELILRAVTNEDPNHKLFNLLYSTLKILAQAKPQKSKNFASLTNAYLLKAISILGYKPELNHCVQCKNPVVHYFSIEAGGAICNLTEHPGYKNAVDIAYAKTIRHLLNTPLIKTLDFSIPRITQKLIQDYIVYHSEQRELHSLNINLSSRLKK